VSPFKVLKEIYRKAPLPPSTRKLIKKLVFAGFGWARSRLILTELKTAWTENNTPLVSVIIPMLGKPDITLNCLRSIAANPQMVSYELILVIPGSSGSDKTLPWKIPGVRMLSSKARGFTELCHMGANSANGQYLHFLASDTLVSKDWLDELIGAYERFNEVAVIGSKVINPDGTLQQESLGLGKDSSAYNFGEPRDPNRPEYSYSRQVEHCSEASILISKKLYYSLGSVERKSLSVSRQDSEIARKAHKAGLKLIYAPASVVHLQEEGLSSGDIFNAKMVRPITKRLKPSQRLVKLLPGYLENDHEPIIEDYTFMEKRVLFIDQYTPKPDQDSGSVTAFNSMLLLREFGFQVTFVALGDLSFDNRYSSLLQKHGIEAVYSPFTPSLDQHLKEYGNRYDLLFVCRADVAASALPSITMHCPNAPVVFHTIDLHFLRTGRSAILAKDWSVEQEAIRYEALETWLIQQTDMTILHSDFEKELLIEKGLDESKLNVSPLPLNIPAKSVGFKARSGIVFVGGFQHSPNIDAITYFCEEIMPIVTSLNPDIILNVIGTHMPEEILRLNGETVKIVGNVDNLDDYLLSFRMSVAPLRYGAGVKGKVGKSLACGTPVVSSQIAVEGMKLNPGDGFLLAEDQQTFARKIVELYSDESTWTKLSYKGKEVAERMWGFEASVTHLSSVLASVGFNLSLPTKKITLF